MTAPRIRPYEAGDTEMLFEAAVESIEDVHPWLPWCHPRIVCAECEAWVALQVDQWNSRAEFQFVIVAADGRFLGGCGLNGLNGEHRFANLGYWVRSSEAGAGVATSAVGQLRDWAFEHTELERLEIVVAVGNKASARVAEKAGATLEGTLRSRLSLHGRLHDAFMYSYVRSDAASPRGDG